VLSHDDVTDSRY